MELKIITHFNNCRRREVSWDRLTFYFQAFAVNDN